MQFKKKNSQLLINEQEIVEIVIATGHKQLSLYKQLRKTNCLCLVIILPLIIVNR